MWSTLNICTTCSFSSSTKCFLGSDHSFDSIVHILNQVDFSSSESSSVRDIENTIISLSVFSMNSSDLNVVLVSNLVELFFVFFLGKHWELDMNGCSQSSTEICWARCDVTKMIIVSELGFFLDLSGSNGESTENSSNISSLLHGDNSELILLIDPDQESLFLIVENTSTSWPVSVEATRLQESISFLEKEVIGNQLSLLFFGHGG